MIFNDDGTGFILKGYTMRKHLLPFRYASATQRFAGTLDRETGLFTILSETENGHVNTYRWYVIEVISENVIDDPALWIPRNHEIQENDVANRLSRRLGASSMAYAAWRETRARDLTQLTVRTP